MNYLILLPIVLPVLIGIILLILPAKTVRTRRNLITMVLIGLTLTLISSTLVICGFCGNSLVLFSIVEDIPIFFSIDEMGRIFASITTCGIFLFGIYSVGYLEMEHGKKIEQNEKTIGKEKRYHAFYLMVYGILLGINYSGNLITLYMFYEFMTLSSAPLVLHTETKEAIIAALKYMFFSFTGAYMALFGIYFLNKYASTMNFTPGGVIEKSIIQSSGKTEFLLVIVFIMILGFGVKAGMFPLHAWLPSAHPVAPASASAALSAIIVKSGVLAVIRVVYYVVGPDFIRGTWVQTTWIILSMITIIMGSALAFKEKLLKKRFAYSTVSNLSYIMLGLAFLDPIAMNGAILHVIFHAIMKGALFMCAGYFIALTGKVYVNDLKGVVRKMPAMFKCLVIASLGLVGIPPTCGLVSKWYLAIGALDSKISVLSWMGPVVLLISALLTAGYLFPIITLGYLNNNRELNSSEKLFAMIKKENEVERYETNYWMLIPIVIFTFFILILGIYPTFLINIIANIANAVM